MQSYRECSTASRNLNSHTSKRHSVSGELVCGIMAVTASEDSLDKVNPSRSTGTPGRQQTSVSATMTNQTHAHSRVHSWRTTPDQHRNSPIPGANQFELTANGPLWLLNTHLLSNGHFQSPVAEVSPSLAARKLVWRQLRGCSGTPLATLESSPAIRAAGNDEAAVVTECGPLNWPTRDESSLTSGC